MCPRNRNIRAQAAEVPCKSLEMITTALLFCHCGAANSAFVSNRSTAWSTNDDRF